MTRNLIRVKSGIYHSKLKTARIQRLLIIITVRIEVTERGAKKNSRGKRNRASLVLCLLSVKYNTNTSRLYLFIYFQTDAMRNLVYKPKYLFSSLNSHRSFPSSYSVKSFSFSTSGHILQCLLFSSVLSNDIHSSKQRIRAQSKQRQMVACYELIILRGAELTQSIKHK